MKRNWGVIAAKVFAAGMLLGALGRQSHDYYTLLRWVVCAVAAFSACQAPNSGKFGWMWLFGAIALVFNPIFPVSFRKETWAFVDVGAALLLLSSELLNRNMKPT